MNNPAEPALDRNSTHITKALRVVLICALACLAAAQVFAGEYNIYIGTFTGAKSKGIYACRMDDASGALTAPALVAETKSPSFLDIDPQHKFLFAINEINRFEGKPAGAVTAFAIDPVTGGLTQLNQRSTVGTGPCHVVIDATHKDVLVANYASGSVAVLPVSADGHLGGASTFIQHHGKSINPSRQEGPHAHCLALDAANRFAFACDLGLDEVLVYKFDAEHGTLTPNEPPFASIKPGSGPRHLVFHPNGHAAYVINELNSTITRFSYDSDRGVLIEKQTISTLPADFKGQNFPAEIAVHPSGKFLYGSNRGHNSIAIYSIDSADGSLKNIGFESTRGKIPRNFAIDPSGKFLLAANQDTDNIAVFRIDAATGLLKFVGQVDVPAPVCIKFYAP
jgi:6-phosphogluconolactonase